MSPTRLEITKPQAVMLIATTVGALAVLSPLFWNHARWVVIFGLFAVLPHAVILSRVGLYPGERSGYSLAIGVSSLLSLVGLLLLAVLVGQRQRDVLTCLFVAGLLATKGFLLWSAIARYRNAISAKPHWRLLMGGIIGPAVYYCFLFVLASGAVVVAARH